MSTNLVMESGNITREPEYSVSKTGVKTLKFAIAVNESSFNKNTNKYDNYANYFECILFGNSSEYWQKKLSMGDHILVEGRLRQARWEKDGNKNSMVQIIVNKIEEFNYLNKKSGGNQKQQKNQDNQYSNAADEDPGYDANSYYSKDQGGFME